MAPRRRFDHKAASSGSAKSDSSPNLRALLTRDHTLKASIPSCEYPLVNRGFKTRDNTFQSSTSPRDYRSEGRLVPPRDQTLERSTLSRESHSDGKAFTTRDHKLPRSSLSRRRPSDGRITRDHKRRRSLSRDFLSDGRVFRGRDTSTSRPGSKRSPVGEAGISSHRQKSVADDRKGTTYAQVGGLSHDPSPDLRARLTRDNTFQSSTSPRDVPSDGRVLTGRDTSTSRPGSKRSPVGEAGISSHRHYDNSQLRERGKRQHQGSVSSLQDRKRGNTPYRRGSLQDDEGLPPKRRRVDYKQQGNALHYASNRCPGRSTECKAQENAGSRTQPIKYKALESICKKTDLEEAVLELTNKEERFKALLESDETIRPDLMKQIIHALHMLCFSKIYQANANDVLRYSTRKHFFNSHLSRFINQMPQDSSNTREGLVVLITRITDIFLTLLQQVGESVANDLPLAQLEIAVRELGKQNVIQQMEQINEKIQHVNNLKEEVLSKAKASAKGESIGDPPENFRDVSIIPQEKDFQHGARPFVRTNVVNGRYDNVEHYLDVQFRLLREDLLIPLREGVRQLRSDRNPARPQGSNHGKAKNIRIYYDVNVLNPVCSTKRMVYRIRFNCRHRNVRHVPWRKSSRLKFGSLVCLSYDDFHTMFFATVENRDSRDLQYGELEVRFENVEAADVNRFIKERESFEMVESEAYFEAYRHNLEALQKITEEELPFKEHIVHCRKEEIRPPKYIDETSTFDFSVIMPKEENDLTLGEDDNDSFTEVPVLDQHNWPSRESLGLNISQLRACKQALTKRFAVIQGPPGTGKTFVGLKIAHMLLHNAKVWQEEEQSPILMISYTNHALDQFLHGLLDVMPKEGEG